MRRRRSRPLGSSADEVISGYRTLTGPTPVVPKWALGLWQSRERYKTQQEMLDVAQEFRKRQIPLDNIVLYWSYWKPAEWGSQEFDPSRFPDPAGLIKTLHERDHLHFMISVWAKIYEGLPVYNDFKAKGYLYPRNIANRTKDWIAPGYTSTFYDAFNPQARQAFWKLMNTKLFTKGIDAWWMDASEPDSYSNTNAQTRKELMAPAIGSSTQQLTVDAPLERLPLFVREGAIIPFGPAVQYAAEKPADVLTLYVYTGKDGAFSLYEDENVNYHYEKGAFATIPLRYSEQTRTLTIGERQGSFPGMLAQRTFWVVWVSPNKATGYDPDAASASSVAYSGSALTVKMP